MSRKKTGIYCNCCGRKICDEEMELRTSFLAIRKDWGYFSDHKDGIRQSVDLCEPCCERLAASFAIPPEEEVITELC